MKRVVITGMGCVTPVGNDVDSFWTSIINGKHGFGEITKFDASDMKVKIAAEVKDFHPESYIEKNEIKRTDLYSQYAIAAATHQDAAAPWKRVATIAGMSTKKAYSSHMWPK